MSAPLYAAGPSHPTAQALPWWVRMMSRLPLAVLYRFTAAVIGLMRRVVRHRVDTVRTNIERSFPDLPVREQRRIETGYYANLSQVLAEVLKMGTISREELQGRVRVRNPALQFFAADRAHLENFGQHL